MRGQNKRGAMSFYLVRSVRTGKPIAYIEARDEQHAIARAGLVHHRVKFPQDELLAAQPAGSERRCCVQFPDRYFRVYDDVDAKDHRGSL